VIKVFIEIYLWLEFIKRNAAIFYKTNSKSIGNGKSFGNCYLKYQSPVPQNPAFNHSGKFTDHLLMANMYRNNSLNTTCDKERWVNSSKDWMEHL